MIGLYDESVMEYETCLNSGGGLESLIGFCEASLAAGKDWITQGAFGRGSYFLNQLLEKAAQGLEYGGKAILWKLIGDTCFTLSKLESNFTIVKPHLLQDIYKKSALIDKRINDRAWSLQDPADDLFAQWLDEEGPLNSKIILSFSGMAYKSALSLLYNETGYSSAIADLWYDLGLSYYTRLEYEDSGNSRDVAMECILTSLQISPDVDIYWNAFGIVCAEKFPKLSQHAFIKAISLNAKVSHRYH